MHQPTHSYPFSASARSETRPEASLLDKESGAARLTPSPPPAAPTAAGATSGSSQKSGRGQTISPFTVASTARTRRNRMQDSKASATMKEFVPRTWQAATAAYSSPGYGAAPPQVVMDPVALLRQCIRYFSSHPETYGRDIHGLLEQEALHVMRLKASEMALVSPSPVPITFGGPSDKDMATSSRRHQNAARAVDSGTGSFLPPLRERPAAAMFGVPYPKSTRSGAQGPTQDDSTFGYGGISFIEPTPGFLALLEGATTANSSLAGTRATKTLGGQLTGGSAAGFPAESIGWEGTLTEQDITAYRERRGTQPLVDEQGPGEADVLVITSGAGAADGIADGQSTDVFAHLHLSEAGRANALGAPGGSPSRLLSSGSIPPYGVMSRSPAETARAPAAPIIVDGAGYETSFLRSQLQQLEAAYNAKSIRMHEMLEENASLITRLQLAESSAESRLAAYNTVQAQLEMLKRELDGWKDKANDASQQAAAQASKQTQQNRKAVSTQLTEAKQETAKLAELWRETERAHQECRRALENSEKEANHTHDHLSDAFHYIERLERRVTRRNQYIELCHRRQQSMEEKYEKLMWCLRELGTLNGVYSYVDALLARDPAWTLVLFTRLQRHNGDFAPTPQRPVATTSSAMPSTRAIVFAKSPNGGLLVDAAFEMHTVYKMVTDSVTAADERRSGLRRLRTNLHGTVACRAARAVLPNVIDYLGGEDSLPDSSDVNKRKLPLLTLASLVLSCPNGRATTPSVASASTQADAILPGTGVSPQTTQFKPDVTATVPNSRQFDQVTLRFLLRQFWKERVQQYTDTMSERKTEALDTARGVVRPPRRSTTTNNGAAPSPVTAFAGTNANAEEEEEPSRNTFLSGLVCFVNRIVTGSPDGLVVPPSRDGAADTEDPLLAIRVAIARKDEEAGLVDNGRVAFATVASARVRYPQSLGTTSAGAAGAGTTSSASPGEERMNQLKTANDPVVGPKAQELLSALYYYSLEYKDSDPDFRLFYLVSHQLIPEMVGINFYANLQAMDRALHARVQNNLTRSSSSSSSAAAAQSANTSSPNEDEPPQTEAPVDALVKVVRVVDTAPLIGEDVEFEEDSDGEGYGSILPGARAAEARSAARGLSRVSVAGGAATRHIESQRVGTDSAKPSSESRRSRAASLSRLEPPATDAGDELRHNLRDYLATLHHRRNDVDFAPLFEEEHLTENVYAPQLPAGWEALNESANIALGPHEELLRSYKESVATGSTRNLGLRYQRECREVFRTQTSVRLSASRGLLPVAEVLEVLQQHAFASYAVTCCGAPRYSLAEAMFASGSPRAEDYADPLDLVGQVPLTEWQLQRLRFALSLDQPSSLVRINALFQVDAHTSSPSHFYDEYLTLTLDLVLRQQSLLIDQLLGACASRHDRYFDDGAEECDGSIPVSFLKTGFSALFRSLGLGKEEANAMVEHLVFYDSLLRLEDEVKLEQFTDAPFMINTSREEIEARSAGVASSSNKQKRSELGSPGVTSPTSPGRTQWEDKTKTQVSPRAGAPKPSGADEDGWDVQDEMETCSLLHLILALRMTFIVWGTHSRPFATKISRVVCSIPIDAELEAPHETKRRVAKSSTTPTARSPSGGAAGGAAPFAGCRRGLWSSAVINRLAERQEVMEGCQLTVKTQYVEAASRVSCGVQGIRNPLRRTQWLIEAQRAKEERDALAVTKTQGEPVELTRKTNAASPQRHRDSQSSCESLSMQTGAGGESAMLSRRRVSPAVLDRYSVNASALTLGLYPDMHYLAPPSPRGSTTDGSDGAASRAKTQAAADASSNKKGKQTTTRKKSTVATKFNQAVEDGSDAEHHSQSCTSALNTSLVALSRMLGLLNTSNAELYTAAGDPTVVPTARKRSKGKKKLKSAKSAPSGLAESLCHVTSSGASQASHDVRLEQAGLLRSAVERVRELVTCDSSDPVPTNSAESEAYSAANRQSGDPSGARGGKRSARAVAFMEPKGAPAGSEHETAVQQLKERRVQLNWTPCFGHIEATTATPNPEELNADGAKAKRVLDVEVLQQACAAMSL